MCSEKYIFCDFDGVLTSVKSGTYFNPNPSGYGFDEKLVTRLLDLVRETGAKLVISSNWRKFKLDGYWIHDGVRYSNPLPNLIRRLGEAYLCSLPNVRHISKVEALDLFLEDDTLDFVIFDDDPDEGFQDSKYADKFVFVDHEVGLSDEDCKMAKKILLGMCK